MTILDAHDIADQIKEEIEEGFPIVDFLIQVEPFTPEQQKKSKKSAINDNDP